MDHWSNFLPLLVKTLRRHNYNLIKIILKIAKKLTCYRDLHMKVDHPAYPATDFSFDVVDRLLSMALDHGTTYFLTMADVFDRHLFAS